MVKWITVISFSGIVGWMGIFAKLRPDQEYAGTILIALVIACVASAFFGFKAEMEKSHKGPVANSFNFHTKNSHFMV